MNTFRNKKEKEIRYFESRETTIKNYVFNIIMELMISDEEKRKEIEDLLTVKIPVISKGTLKKLLDKTQNTKFNLKPFCYVVGYEKLNKFVMSMNILSCSQEEQRLILNELKSYIVCSEKSHLVLNQKTFNTKKKDMYYKMIYFRRMNKYIL